jgi:hypothetical protein
LITGQQPLLDRLAVSYDGRVGTDIAVCAPRPHWIACYDANHIGLGVTRVHVRGESWSATWLVQPDGKRWKLPVSGRLSARALGR